MGMSIDELITFCEEEEQNHRVKCKRADDASGYTRSKDKNIRTSDATREELYGYYYKQIADTMRKYQMMQEVLEKVWNVPSCMLDEAECLNKIMETYRTVR